MGISSFQRFLFPFQRLLVPFQSLFFPFQSLFIPFQRLLTPFQRLLIPSKGSPLLLHPTPHSRTGGWKNPSPTDQTPQSLTWDGSTQSNSRHHRLKLGTATLLFLPCLILPCFPEGNIQPRFSGTANRQNRAEKCGWSCWNHPWFHH